MRAGARVRAWWSVRSVGAYEDTTRSSAPGPVPSGAAACRGSVPSSPPGDHQTRGSGCPSWGTPRPSRSSTGPVTADQSQSSVDRTSPCARSASSWPVPGAFSRASAAWKRSVRAVTSGAVSRGSGTASTDRPVTTSAPPAGAPVPPPLSARGTCTSTTGPWAAVAHNSVSSQSRTDRNSRSSGCSARMRAVSSSHWAVSRCRRSLAGSPDSAGSSGSSASPGSSALVDSSSPSRSRTSRAANSGALRASSVRSLFASKACASSTPRAWSNSRTASPGSPHRTAQAAASAPSPVVSASRNSWSSRSRWRGESAGIRSTATTYPFSARSGRPRSSPARAHFQAASNRSDGGHCGSSAASRKTPADCLRSSSAPVRAYRSASAAPSDDSRIVRLGWLGGVTSTASRSSWTI